jgi:hypothetical protein
VRIISKRMWAWCVRTVRLKMLFAEGPKIAAAIRDMLATLGPGVCSICVSVPVRGMDLVEHAPKREKVWGKMDGIIPDERPKTLGYSGRSTIQRPNKQKLTSRMSRMRSLEDLRLVNCSVTARERGAGEAASVATGMVW